MSSSSASPSVMRKIAATAASRTLGGDAGAALAGASARSSRASMSSACTRVAPLFLDLSTRIDPRGNAAGERRRLVALRAQHLGRLRRTCTAPAIDHDLALGELREGLARDTAHVRERDVNRVRDAKEVPLVLLANIEEHVTLALLAPRAQR